MKSFKFISIVTTLLAALVFSVSGVTPARAVAVDSPGDGTYQAGAANTTTSITSSPNPALIGQLVTFTATVTSTAGTPDGTVVFTNNGVTITGCGSQMVTSGQAICTTSALTARVQPITATYSGDTNYNASLSAALYQGVHARPAVGAGGFHTCELKADGTLACWGANSYGQLTVPSPNTAWAQVSAGEHHTCGLKTDGTLACWGANSYEQLNAPIPNTDWVQVSAGLYHTCGLKADGTLACWGYDNYGQATMPITNTDWVQVSAGAGHTCGLKADSTLACWGDNTHGQTTVPSPNTDWVQVSAGGFHTCGLKADSTLACQGDNTSGQTTVPGPNVDWVQVSAGLYHTCGLKADGTLTCWGDNYDGQTTVPSPNADWVQVSAGLYHTCGLKADATLRCWGSNDDGEAPVITLTPAALSNVNLGLAYTQSLTATGTTGATPPYTVSVISGAVPTGLTLNATGTWSGTPTATGVFNFTAQGQDANQLAGTQAYTVTVDCFSATTVTTDADSGNGSLREAMAGVCPGGTIDFGGDYTIGLTTGQLVIDKDMTIDGNGHIITIDGRAQSRVFYVDTGVTFTLRHVTVTNGSTLDGGGLYLDGATVTLKDMQISNNVASQYGGGIYNNGGRLDIDPTTIYSNSAALDGGGLYNAGGTLILTDTAFIGNTANGNWPNGNGGGLYSGLGTLVLSQTQFISNTANYDGGGAYLGFTNEGLPRASINRPGAGSDTADMVDAAFQGNVSHWGSGGGLYLASGSADVSDSTFSGNAVEWANGLGGGAGGGGFYNAPGATALFTHTTFSRNTATCGNSCNGGGLYNAGTLSLAGMTIADNTALGGEGTGSGGGLYGASGSILIMANSTVSGNTAANAMSNAYGQGGGFALEGDATITNTTISGNRATDGGGIYYTSIFLLNNVTLAGNVGGGVFGDAPNTDGGGRFDLQNTIIGDNTDIDGTALDCARGVAHSLGYNLIETIGICTLNGDLTGVITDVDPQLSALQDNGGSTWTMALAANSPALEAGNPAASGSDRTACEATDQRGVSRPQGARCDMGAYEAQGAISKAVDVTIAQAGHRANYTLLVYAAAPIVTGAISDTLPVGLTFAGPVTLDPAGAGTAGTPPAIVTNINLSAGQWLTITFPVTVNVGVANGTRIINTAVLTGPGLLPLSASVAFDVDTFDLSSSAKLVNTATAMAGDGLTYTIHLTNTSLHKDSTFTLTDVIPASAVYVSGSLTTTTGSAGYAGSVITWTGGLSGTVGSADYVYGDSSGKGSLSGVVYNWIDISATGTLVNFPTPDDDYAYPITLPFAFNFYGIDYTNLAVATNGTVYFEDALLGLGNTPIPSDTGDGVNTFIASLWDDLYMSPGAVYYEVQGAAPHRRVVIEYYQVSGCCATPDSGTWEIILYEDRPDISMQYQDVNFGDASLDYGAGATVGIQNSISQGTQYSYNTAALNAGLAIVFAPPPVLNSTADLTFAVTTIVPLPDRTWITNTAIVSDSYGDTWSLSADTLLSNPADLSIAKQAAASVNGLAPLTYTLNVTNSGPLAAAFVTVTDNLPAGVIYVGAAGAGWSCSQASGVVTCTQPNLGVGAAADIIIAVTAPNISGTLINTALITSTAADADVSNNTATVTTTATLNTRSVITATAGSGSGSIALNPPGGTYLYGAVVTATATANVGSTFTGWSGDLTGNANPGTLTLDSDKSITATFTLNTYVITPTAGANGSLTPGTPQTVNHGANQLFAVTANPNYHTLDVGVDGVSVGAVSAYTFTNVTANHTITAVFAINTYTLIVATAGNGSVTPTTSAYAYGTVVPITATANVGSAFTGWTGDLSGNTNPTSILIDSDKSITATFALNTYTLTVATVGNGSVTPTTSVYAYGTVVPITATANVGSAFTGWSGDLSGSTNPTSILIDSDKSITATFALNTYTLTVATVGNGSVTPTTSAYAYGTVVPVTATANVGSSFVSWSGNLSGSVNPTSILIDSDKSITATFALNTYTLTVATVGNGSVTPTTGIYAYGTVVPITATANVGSSFSGWSGDLSGSTNPTSILIDGNKSITATFALNTYTLTVATVGDGNVTPTTSTYVFGTVVPVTATANVGSSFAGWSGSLSGNVNPTSILIDGNKSITATFALNTYTLTAATTGNGVVNPNAGTHAYLYGTVVPITATANVGSAFTGWSGDLTGNTNPTSILVDGNKFITATFTLNTYTLTVVTAGTGSGAVTPTVGAHGYDYDTVVTVTQAANTGSAFMGWGGACSGLGACVVTLTSDQTVTATFTLNAHTLITATTGNGRGTIELTPPGGVYDHGTVLTVTAMPRPGSLFTGWSGDLNGSGSPTTLVMDSDKSITATFTAIPGYFSVYLPLVSYNYLRLPDLIVQSVTASSDVITVVIKNIGDGPAEQAFWVDAYINPTPPPAAVNEIWWDLDRSNEGVAWGVIEPIVPIQPGEVYTLTSNGAYVSPDRTFFSGHLPVGTPIYAQVDSYNAATNYGAVLESHEYFHRLYNNILGPIYSMAGSGGPLGLFQPIGPQLNPALPYRSVRP